MAQPYSVTVKYSGRPANTVVVPATAKDRKEFDNFEDLTRKLTQVPKSEVDEKRKG